MNLLNPYSVCNPGRVASMASTHYASDGKFRQSVHAILSSIVVPCLVLMGALIAFALPVTVSAGDNNRLSVLLYFDASGIHLQRIYGLANARVRQNNSSLYLNKQVVKHFATSSAAFMQQRVANSNRVKSAGNLALDDSTSAIADLTPMSFWFSADGDLLLTETIDDPRVVRVPGPTFQPSFQPGANVTSISREEGVFLLRGPLLAATLRVYLPDLNTSHGAMPHFDSWFDISVSR